MKRKAAQDDKIIPFGSGLKARKIRKQE
ncbi:hypothetical protein CARUB_v100185481mg, partial [Capsella rubella]